MGTFNENGIVSAYDKAYNHDARLMDTPPPAFPTTGQTEKLVWKELDPATDISLNTF